jgi:hypothetical protein
MCLSVRSEPLSGGFGWANNSIPYPWRQARSIPHCDYSPTKATLSAFLAHAFELAFACLGHQLHHLFKNSARDPAAIQSCDMRACGGSHSRLRSSGQFYFLNEERPNGRVAWLEAGYVLGSSTTLKSAAHLGQVMGVRSRSKNAAVQLRHRRLTPRALVAGMAKVLSLLSGASEALVQKRKSPGHYVRGFHQVRGPPPVHPWSAV